MNAAPKHTRDMTADEIKAFERQHLRRGPHQPAAPGKPVDSMTAAELTDFETTVGIRPSHTEAMRRRNSEMKG